MHGVRQQSEQEHASKKVLVMGSSCVGISPGLPRGKLAIGTALSKGDGCSCCLHPWEQGVANLMSLFVAVALFGKTCLCVFPPARMLGTFTGDVCESRRGRVGFGLGAGRLGGSSSSREWGAAGKGLRYTGVGHRRASRASLYGIYVYSTTDLL